MNDNLIAIKNFPEPLSKKDLQRILGKINFYRKFIPYATDCLNPLYKLLNNNIQFKWSNECQKAFDKVKTLLINKPILKIFDPKKTNYLFTDASKVGVGAILKQETNNILHPIGYFSKKLLPYQINYTITELECLAIVEGIEYFHHYLYDNKFIVITDHQALKWLKGIKKPNSRLFKWTLKLSQYNFEVKYSPGKDNIEADALSRGPVEQISENKEYVRICNLIELNEIASEQENYFLTHSNERERLRMEENVAGRTKHGNRQIFIPPSLQTRLLNEFHIDFGHIGTKQMLTQISRRYFWPNMTADIKKLIESCQICQTNKTRREKELGTLSITGPASTPMEIISMDTIGGFDGFKSPCKYLHVAIDHFTRFAWTQASRNQKARDFIQLLNTVIQLATPRLILTDRYPGIRCKSFEQFCDNKNINVKYIATQCPHSNGMAERFNQTFVNKLRCLHAENRKTRWDNLVQTATNMYNIIIQYTARPDSHLGSYFSELVVIMKLI